MKKLILLTSLTVLIGSCSPSRQNTAEQPLTKDNTAVPQPASLTDSLQPVSLLNLPVNEEGITILSEGFYESEYKSYCLQPGTPDPGPRDAYLQAPLSGYRKDIVASILRNSQSQPDLPQHNIQLLLWSVMSGSDYNKLSPAVKRTANSLLNPKQVFELQGGVMGMVKTVAVNMPVGTNSEMRRLFELGNSSYEAFEQLAMRRGPSRIYRPDYAADQWYTQPGGYFVRYFPSSYKKVKIQVYVPKGSLDSSGRKNGRYLLFDPVQLMAVPANSDAQRLGIGAPMVDIIRKVIIINQGTTPVPPKGKRPVSAKQPKAAS
jgi:hypothetical protein